MIASPHPRSLFLGHGAPTLALSEHPATDFLKALGRHLAVPCGLIVVSPHREAASFTPGCAERFSAWHDFRGFARELHALRYGPPGDPELASRVAQSLLEAGLPTQVSDDARIDHGIWVPLSLMWPQATVPVVPVAQTRAGPAAHLALGRALRPFADEGYLVVGSGSIVHNLGDLDWGDEFAPVRDWAQTFDDWIAQRLANGDIDALVDYRRQAPQAERAQPSEEHLMPLFVALGAGGAAEPLYRGFSHGTLSLSAYAFA